MRYFKYELWKNSTEETEARLWNENSHRYYNYFNSIKKFFSNDFINSYLNFKGFHDYKILSIRYADAESVCVELKKNKTKIDIRYEGVKSFSVDFNNCCNELQIGDLPEWGYDEFYKLKDNYFTHSVITSSGIEIEIGFKKISVLIRGNTE
ncbi:MAG: hypothetical protein IJ349_02765 [Clostridia bacterium]|nr:hypothetical protein [Clostridia bacterium]